ncbi:MAG: hypothetical protein J5497_05610, partial [Selenomonadaceae bacterium]|nr:hypothetical protein [Selenomonadaceae bacterium]
TVSNGLITLTDTKYLNEVDTSGNYNGGPVTLQVTDTQADSINYSLSLGEDFNYSKSYKADYPGALGTATIEAVAGSAGTFTYYSANYTPGYAYGYSSKETTAETVTSYIYNMPNLDQTFTITGLRSDLVSYIAENGLDVADEVIDFSASTGEVNLVSYDVLPTGLSAGQSIAVEANLKTPSAVTSVEVYEDIPYGLSAVNFDVIKTHASFDEDGKIYTTRTYKAILGETAGDSLALTVVRGEVGGESLAFTGFVPLKTDDSDDEKIVSTDDTPIFQEVTPNFNASGEITGYSFALEYDANNPSAAINWEAFRGGSASMLSIIDLAENSGLSVVLKITGEDTRGLVVGSGSDGIIDLFQPEVDLGKWDINGNTTGRYTFKTTAKSDYFTPEGVSAEDYKPETSNVNIFNYHKAVESQPVKIQGKLATGGISSDGTPIFFSMSEVYANADGTGSLSSVVLTVNRAAFTNDGLSNGGTLNNFASNYTVSLKAPTGVKTNVRLNTGSFSGYGGLREEKA